MKRKLGFCLLIATFLNFWSCEQPEVTTFYFVRHAEKVEDNIVENHNDDPQLTAEGKLRAQKLREMLSTNKITAIYSTAFQRNLNTVKPLADFKNIEIQNYEWHGWQPMLDDAKTAYAGGTILVSGHGDNLLPMIEYLNDKKPQEKLGSHEYDKIFKVESYPDTVLVTTLPY